MNIEDTKLFNVNIYFTVITKIFNYKNSQTFIILINLDI